MGERVWRGTVCDSVGAFGFLQLVFEPGYYESDEARRKAFSVVRGRNERRGHTLGPGHPLRLGREGRWCLDAGISDTTWDTSPRPR